MDWTLYPNFSAQEVACRHTGRCDMVPEFMGRLQRLRLAYGRPMRITSCYRDRTHPIEARKVATGAHALGRSVDIAVTGRDVIELIVLAVRLGFAGIGVHQRGNGRFIHLDDVSGDLLPRPGIWSY